MSFVPQFARASINVSQLLVHSPAPQLREKLAEKVEAYLKELGPAALEGQARRTIGIAGPLHGWALVADSSVGGVDPHLAGQLVTIKGARVLRVELHGDTLSLLWGEVSAGPNGSTKQTPRLGYDAAPYEGPMPHYKDVERLAWRFLAKYRVPTALRLRGLSMFEKALASGRRGAGQPIEAAPKDSLIAAAGASLPAIILQWDKGSNAAGRRDLTLPLSKEARSGRLPVPADAPLPAGVGPPGMQIDLLRLAGTPSPSGLRSLQRVLRGIQARHHAQDEQLFCHLLKDPYRHTLYKRLARGKHPCAKVYRLLLAKEKTANVPKAAHHRPKESEDTE